MRRSERYADRHEAGLVLAAQIADELDLTAGPDPSAGTRPVVLALPRGGLPVAAPVAEALDAILDVVVVRKLGTPGQRELAMGALAGIGGHLELIRNEAAIAAAGVSPEAFARVLKRERSRLRTQLDHFGAGHAADEIRGQTAIIIDDGLATGSTMLAAIKAVRQAEPERLMAAVPVGSDHACDLISPHVDDLVCAWCPAPFYAVAQAYVDFDPVSTATALAILDRCR